MNELVRQTLAKDRRAILRARALGAPAVPTLVQLAENPDAEVREIALYGLDEIGDLRASPTFVKALLDPDPMVRGVAMRALHKRPDPAVYAALLDAYDESPEPVVRHNVALILGRIGLPTVKRAALVDRTRSEKDPFAMEGLIVALSKLGDENAQERFVALLHAARDRELGRFLDHVDYLHQSWVLPALSPILDDASPVLRVGVHGVPGPEYLRACDRAVNLIAAISGWRFSFAVNGLTNYSPEALAEAKRFVDAIPKPD